MLMVYLECTNCFDICWLDVKAAGIQNAYLQARSSEEHYIVCAAEGSQYWVYVPLFADDGLVISDNGEKILREDMKTI